MRRILCYLLCLLPVIAGGLLDASTSSALVVKDSAAPGSPDIGLALAAPDTSASLPQTVSTVSGATPCTDPSLLRYPDLWFQGAQDELPSTALCWNGGTVMHEQDTYAFTWDPDRMYWETTRDYVEQFLQDVAAGSGSLTSPYSVISQYADSAGRPSTTTYGGGCIDYGPTGGFSCDIGGETSSGDGGTDYPTGQATCAASGLNQFAEQPNGTFGPPDPTNGVCVTDASIRAELQEMVPRMKLPVSQNSLVAVLLPPGVQVCLDSTTTSTDQVCSAEANSTAEASFCSYHSEVLVGGVTIAYVVQPWTAGWQTPTGCDDPGLPSIPSDPSATQLATDVGARLVSPLSQAQIASIVNPDFTGWFASDGAEINDNGCSPLGDQLDAATIGASGQNPYFLQHEFNDAGAIQSDPNAPRCAGQVTLIPSFVAPSPVNAGDIVQLDGSTTVSTLLVPSENYVWKFSDGTTLYGPSVEHAFTRAGNYKVDLTVTDLGGNTQTDKQMITVLGPSGTSGTTKPAAPRFSLRLQLMPQSLKRMLRHGLAMALYSSVPAAGVAEISIPRAAARKAHLRAKRGADVTIGRGTIAGVAEGTTSLDIHISRATARKLAHLHRVTMTIRVTLVDAAGGRAKIDVAGRY